MKPIAYSLLSLLFLGGISGCQSTGRECASAAQQFIQSEEEIVVETTNYEIYPVSVGNAEIQHSPLKSYWEVQGAGKEEALQKELDRIAREQQAEQEAKTPIRKAKGRNGKTPPRRKQT
jgi:hypothetical protein